LYNYTLKSNFWAGNEFLNFDSKNIQNSNLNIASVQRKYLYNHFLYTDEIRKNKVYTYEPDINGGFVIRTLDSEETDTEADYTFTHFSLAAPEPFKNKEVYVYGKFNNYNFTEMNQMTYNPKDKIYEVSIPLKQGFYNYSFATLSSSHKKNISLTEINGSYSETENEYTVIVYHRPFGSIYDRVIGVGNGFFDQNK